MSLELHTIKPSRGAKRKRKRVGRGNASGHGTYSTRGLKGQKSRSGVSNLKRLGMKMTLMRTPKKRGFKSLKSKDQVINIIDINNNFKNGDLITPKTLMAKSLIDSVKANVKILGKGELKLNKLQLENIKVSKSVSEQIKKNGGTIKI